MNSASPQEEKHWRQPCCLSCSYPYPFHRQNRPPLPPPSSCGVQSCQELLLPAVFPASVPRIQPSHSIRQPSMTCRKSSQLAFDSPRPVLGKQAETPLPVV